jgi:hypothetical protein
MSNKIKPSQLTRLGYEYQDLLCIKLLVEWYHNPDKYQWISIESSSIAGQKFQGLDDVIALNKNNRYELYQVKFTIDAQRDDLKLSFSWLCKKKENGTSMLQKWASDVYKYAENNQLEKAILVTNRIPDETFSQILDSGFVNVSRIPTSDLEIIYEQLGGKEKTDYFFKIFNFKHSQTTIEKYENKLKDLLVPDHTNLEGWYHFLRSVTIWATRKNQPSPDGRIYHYHIEELLKLNNSQSLSQFFDIPKGYIPSEQDFHNVIWDKTQSSGAWVISGKPGMGKSTYLSFLATKLMDEGTPVLRHHYSLSSESEIDRISYANAEKSLQFQLKELFPNRFNDENPSSNTLEKWLNTAIYEAKRQNKQLVIIIDGLDHVGRERTDINQLSHLVNRLLPFKERVCLIFGTQPISSSKLPTRMLSEIPKDSNWLTFPPMDMLAIRNWLECLVENETILFHHDETYRSQQIEEIAEAFYKVSGGYPLYLIYSLRILTYTNKYLSKYEIERLPICPPGDIHQYYNLLWINLSPQAQQVLLQIACVDFLWPDRNSLAYCFEDSLDFAKAFEEIGFLFEKRLSGITPFHSSIIVHVRNKREYTEQYESLLKKAKKWIDSDAPGFWKWGWQWVISSQLGDTNPLLTGITREWLIKSICKGYPQDCIKRIFSIAEKEAFTQERFQDLVRISLLQHRFLNGPEFQIQEYHEYIKIALNYDFSGASTDWRIDHLHTMNEGQISAVAFNRKNSPEIIDRCFDEIIKRIRFYVKNDVDSLSHKLDNLIGLAFDCLTYTDEPNLEKICWLLEKVDDKEQYFIRIIDNLVKADALSSILEFPKNHIPLESTNYYWDNFIFACCDLEISLSDRPEKEIYNNNIYRYIIEFLNGNKIIHNFIYEKRIISSYKEVSYQYYSNIFFYEFAKVLYTNSYVIIDKDFNNLDSIIIAKNAERFFEYAASKIAQKVNSNEKINIFYIYDLIKEIKLPDRLDLDFESQSIWHNISKSLTYISITLYRLLKNTSLLEEIDEEKILHLSKNQWFLPLNWLSFAVDHNISHILSKKLVSDFISNAFQNLSAKKDNTSTLTNECFEITKLSFMYDLEEQTRHGMALTAKHILGYGYRKDTTLHELYESIDECGNHQVGNISDWIRRLSSFTNDIFDFTEREIRHIPGWRIRLIAQHLPTRLADEFKHNLNEHNWSLCNKVLESFVQFFPLSSSLDQALLKSQVNYEVLKQLEVRSENNIELKKLFNEQIEFLGGFPPAPRDSDNGSIYETKPIDIDICHYPPESLKELCNELESRNIWYEEEFLENWISHWIEQGQGSNILQAYTELINNDANFPRVLQRSLDSIFQLSRRLRGLKKSYNLAILSIQENRYWSRYSGSKAEEKLLNYAKLYKKNWQSFLKDSLVGEKSNSNLADWFYTPSSGLVKFYIAVGEHKLAKNVTETMLECLEEEIAHLPLSELYWSQSELSQTDISSHILLEFYKWPDKVARLRTAQQISILLEENNSFRSLYLNHFSKLKYEVDVTDYLSILFHNKDQNFHLEELLLNINKQSILSNAILKDLGYNLEVKVDTSFYTKNENNSFLESLDFRKAQNGLAPIYLNILKNLGKSLNYPLISHCAFEWESIRDKNEINYFGHHNFINEQFYPQDRVSCSISSDAETIVLSAYLRTIAFAYKCLNLSYEEALSLSYKVSPFYKKYVYLEPSKAPIAWSSIIESQKNGKIPDINDLDEYLKAINQQNEVILYGSGPIRRASKDINIDLEVQVFHSLNNIKISSEEIYSWLKNDQSHMFDITPLSQLRYPNEVGRWQTDQLKRGYTTPTFAIGNNTPIVNIGENSIEYKCGNILNAKWIFWHHHWYPANYQELGPSLGTSLLIPKNILEFLKYESGGDFYLLGKMTIVDKHKFSSEEKITELYSRIQI